MRIIFTGGGSGGHLYPAIAVAREIKKIAEEERIIDLQLFYFGPEENIPEIAEKEEIIFVHTPAGKMRRYFSLLNITDLFKTAIGLAKALWQVFVILPDVVFAKGGYGSFPVLFAARLYRIPVIIHESDAVPGRVNAWAGKWAAKVAISFAAAAKYFPKEKTALTGVPIFKRVPGGRVDAAREAFAVFSERPVALFTGGSQGAEVINQTVTQILPDLVRNYEIIHLPGTQNFEDVAMETTQIVNGGGGAAFYHLAPFLDEVRMRLAYSIADLVVSRAGATVVFEIAAEGKPSILIPLKNSAQDHQRENAYEYAASGAAVVIEQNNLTPSVLFNEIKKLMDDGPQRKRMSEAALKFARPEAAEIIAREILKLGLH